MSDEQLFSRDKQLNVFCCKCFIGQLEFLQLKFGLWQNTDGWIGHIPINQPFFSIGTQYLKDLFKQKTLNPVMNIKAK